MFLARVVGRVVASVKAEGLAGQKLLLVRPEEADGTAAGDNFVACDAAQAGPGDRVWCVSGREAALALEPDFVPVDATVVGIVDEVG